MSSAIEVPGWVLVRLGGMVIEDPPILVRSVVGGMPVLMHPAEHVDLMPGDQLVLPACLSALLRVVGRHLDVQAFDTDQVPIWAPLQSPGQELEWVLGTWPACQCFGATPTPPPWVHPAARPTYTHVPALFGITPDQPTVAAAAVALHLATDAYSASAQGDQ